MKGMIDCPVCGKKGFVWNMPDGPFREKVCRLCLYWSLKIEREYEKRHGI